MYFIARNSTFYNYIAHTSLKRLYAATALSVAAFIMFSLYCVYYPLLAHILVLKTEINGLQKKCDDICTMDKTSNELSPIVESYKKNIIAHAVIADARQEHCYKRMLFILDTLTKQKIKLNGYDSCAEKDKSWYAKNSAHFQVSAPLSTIMTFLETIKNARTMISIDQINITRSGEDMVDVDFDVEVITVKK